MNIEIREFDSGDGFSAGPGLSGPSGRRTGKRNQVSPVVVDKQYSESLQDEIFSIIRDFVLTAQF